MLKSFVRIYQKYCDLNIVMLKFARFKLVNIPIRKRPSMLSKIFNYTFCFIFFLLFLSNISRAQDSLYVGLSGGALYVIWPATCSSAYIGNSGTMTDIAICPSGELYGISGSTIYDIDPLTGNSSVAGSMAGVGGNNLVCGPDNNLYLISGSTLYSVDPNTFSTTNLGNIGYSSAGDLTFYQGDIFLAATGNNLIQIDQNYNPTLVGNMNANGSVYGVSTLTSGSITDCSIDQYMIAAAGNDIYSMDPLTGDLILQCPDIVPGSIWGNASPGEAVPPIVNAGEDTLVEHCVGDAIVDLSQFNTGAMPGGIWYDELGNPLGSSQIDFSTWPSGTMNGYQYIITDANCEDTANITIETIDFPVSLGNDTILCLGNTLVLGEATHNGSLLNGVSDHYTWSTGETSQQITISDTGYYSAEVNSNGCIGEDTIYIGLYTENVYLGEDTSICPNTQAVLISNIVGDAYSWSSGGSSISSTVGVGEHILDVFKNNCWFSDTINVNQTIIPNWGLGNDTIMCPDHDLELSASGPVTEYVWWDNTHATTHMVDEAGIYTLYAFVNGCWDQDQIFVSYQNLTLELGESPVLCSTSDSVLLQSNLAFQDYIWSTGATSSYIYGYANEGYSLSATDHVGCVYFDTIVVNYNEPKVYLGEDLSACITENIILNAGSNFEEYHWSTGEVSEKIVVNETGTYTVYAIDSLGCVAEDSVEVIIENCGIYVPSSFSPNDDNLNDLFFALYTEGNVSNLKIYNRWGDVIYNGDNLWDGTKNGKKVKDGVYIYEITYTNVIRETSLLRGRVVVLK